MIVPFGYNGGSQPGVIQSGRYLKVASEDRMKRALIIRHHEAETMGDNFRAILEQHGFEFIACNIFEAAPRYDVFDPPSLDEVSLIMAFGGPMSVNDDLPALHAERRYLREALAMDKPVFGVCLGAQMMATALGGGVESSGGYQFGLRKIHVTAEGDSDPVFGKIEIPLVPTLHGECFTVPDGAVKLAEGDMLCRDGSYRRINMAFRYGLSYAFQFEPQLTLEEMKIWDRVFSGDYEMMGPAFDSKEESARNIREFIRFAPQHQRQMTAMLESFLQNASFI